MTSSSYVVDSHDIDRERLLDALHDVGRFVPTKDEKKWFQLIHEMPSQLRSALLLELKAGNAVTSVQYANWPQKGSIVISLGAPFKNDFSDNSFGVSYRVLNDPHYWQADIHQVIDGVEHLIIT